MTPEEAIALLKNPKVLQQLVELTRDPGLVQRFREISSGDTVAQQLAEIVKNPEIARALEEMAHRTEFYQHMSGAMIWAAVLISVPIAISVVTLVLVIYNTIQVRRLTRERDEP